MEVKDSIHLGDEWIQHSSNMNFGAISLTTIVTISVHESQGRVNIPLKVSQQ